MSCRQPRQQQYGWNWGVLSRTAVEGSHAAFSSIRLSPPCRNAVISGPTSCALSSRTRCPPPLTVCSRADGISLRHHPVVHVRCHRVVIPAQDQRLMPDRRQAVQAGPPGERGQAERRSPEAARLGHLEARGQFRLGPHPPAEHRPRAAGEPVGVVAARVHHVQQRRGTAGHGHPAERGGRQDQLVYPPGVGQGHLLGDRAAERHSQDVGGSAGPGGPGCPRRCRPGPASTSGRTAPGRSRCPGRRR